ncbi:MAG: TRAP transporter large permease subunit [Desulfobacterales bacterium]
MEPGMITLLLVICMIFGLVSGLPIAFVLGAIGTIFTYFLWGPHAMLMITSTIFGKAMMSFGLLAIPLFILMGNILQHSGVADRLFSAFYIWGGKLGGGLAVAAIIVCTLFAAMTGIGGAGTVTMGLIALPAMVSRGYNKKLALGCIGAGGALGILLPPSIIMIIYGMITQTSIGKLFAAGILPGLLLAGLFIAYILIVCKLYPSYGPGVPEKETLTLKEKVVNTKSVIGPLLLILAVLGAIFGGIATPTEGAAIGAFGSLILMITSRKLNWSSFKDVSMGTLRYSCMVLWIIFGAYCFSTIYTALGAAAFFSNLVQDLPFGYWGVFILLQLIFFVLGTFLDPGAIVMITAPIAMPVVKLMGFDPIWFGVIFVMNMQVAYISPPFGYNLFYLKSIAPPGIEIKDIYLAIIPFIVIQIIALIIVAIFPQIALWIPDLLFGV